MVTSLAPQKRAALLTTTSSTCSSLLGESRMICKTSAVAVCCSKASARCFLALASTVDDPVEGPAAAERQRRDADRAVATLRRLIAMGFANSDSLKTDPDFDALRARPEFQALLTDKAFPADPFAH